MCGPLLQVLPNLRQQLTRAKRLRHIVIASRRSRFLSFTAERIRRDCDDRDRAQRHSPESNHAERDWQRNAVIDRDLLGQVLTNLCQQFARAVGFRDIGVAAGSMRFAVVAAQGIGSDGDNRNVF